MRVYIVAHTLFVEYGLGTDVEVFTDGQAARKRFGDIVAGIEYQGDDADEPNAGYPFEQPTPAEIPSEGLTLGEYDNGATAYDAEAVTLRVNEVR